MKQNIDNQLLHIYLKSFGVKTKIPMYTNVLICVVMHPYTHSYQDSNMQTNLCVL